MKIQITITILLGFLSSISAQVENEKDMIIKNKVKESIEKHCFAGSNSSCTAIWETYDRRGNAIEWNMGRLGTRYKMVYDKKDRKIFTIWIDKIDTTKIDSFPHIYDTNNQLIKSGKDTFRNFYNSKQQLIKQLSEDQQADETIVCKTKTFDWTPFGKLKRKITETEIIDSTKPSEYGEVTVYRTEYEYDGNHNVFKEVYYNEDVIKNTIRYTYDTSNRLIEKREKNSFRIEMINHRKYGNRSDISELITRISYYKNGAIKEKYTYFSDPCMSLDNHYLYKHYYLNNGLLERADAYEKGDLVYSISYEYEYYTK
ncbi:hypothetical protein [Aquimarina litoralis]|uniref:hypothetical protein n=1 Tax=Aquimarina litoralis TaxID=584605 RepID=UPI001C55D035|nr:hypothetical protein [Aquimarina litoralis]MBW1294984.1 hypothetical protein [Aquimarina litoralis]